jgi:site-specific DNA-cytosine methylase
LIAAPLEASDGHHGYSSPRGDGADNLIVDENLVTAFYPTGGSKDGFWQENLSPPMKVGTGVGAPAGIGIAQTAGVRRLTPTECERLQALPDEWTNLSGTPDSRRYAALGDAVTATVAEWIGRRLIQCR